MNSTQCKTALCCAALFLAASLSPSLHAQTITLKLGPTPPPVWNGVSATDCCFLRQAAVTDEKEIAISKAVLGQLSSSELKAFARKMIADHSAANAELIALAHRKGAGFSVNDDSQSLDDWSKKSDDIDRRYVREIISDHLDAVDLFERAEKSGDPDVAAFATRTLVTLQEHLVLAHDVRKTVD